MWMQMYVDAMDFNSLYPLADLWLCNVSKAINSPE